MNDGQTWYSISVTVPPEASEAVESAFNSLDSLGTEINHLRKKNGEAVTVVGYFNELPDHERVDDELLYSLRAYDLTEDAILQIERSKVEDADWLAEWKKHWRPTEISQFVISPPWCEVEDRSKIVIRIEPNMAFGTGTHDTTRLCVQAISERYGSGDSFLDVGTGTGILAIAAAKLNLESQISSFRSLACDTDVDSVAIAKENARANGVENLIAFFIGTIDEDTPQFDFVCANLTLDVITPLLPLLTAKTKKTLVLSGILADQTDEIVRSLAKHGINDPQIKQSGEWISVVVSIR
jgi:ribosomal protein L11 methyltransferase